MGWEEEGGRRERERERKRKRKKKSKRKSKKKRKRTRRKRKRKKKNKPVKKHSGKRNLPPHGTIKLLHPGIRDRMHGRRILRKRNKLRIFSAAKKSLGSRKLEPRKKFPTEVHVTVGDGLEDDVEVVYDGLEFRGLRGVVVFL
jgi:hypothetical protein